MGVIHEGPGGPWESSYVQSSAQYPETAKGEQSDYETLKPGEKEVLGR